MDINKFVRIAESLRQYRRAELKDFDRDLGDNPAIDILYIDPLPSNAVLTLILSSSTTFLCGKKGTGKSTIFAKAQSIIRKQAKDLSIYIDVKSIYDLVNAYEVPVQQVTNISEDILQSHFIRKTFLGSVISDLINELTLTIQRLSLFDKWKGKKRSIQDVINRLEKIKENVKKGVLATAEIPILQLITKKNRDQRKQTEHSESSLSGNLSIVPSKFGFEAKVSNFDEILLDNETYINYSDAILQSFPFNEIIEEIKELLDGLGMSNLIIFFDDFSEISYNNQRLFVDIVLAPLNNSSNEKIKLKIAGYPGRIYYGKIDPGKIEIINLDFSKIYKDKDLQITEKRAIDYTTRLLTKRFEAFKADINEYFDPKMSIEEYMRLIFECTFNVPRIMGYILNYCYRDRISRDIQINTSSIKLAAQKYYEDVLIEYFDRVNRFALEPFDRKLDRYIQQDLLKLLISEIKEVRKKIITKDIGGSYFEGLSNPPASHFSISSEFEALLASLELNFYVTKYHEMTDKDGNDVSIYALNYGICESENIPWGYPRGRRDDRSYFVQRCFSYNRVLHEFFARKQTIRCKECGASFSIEKKDSFELFDWLCPECRTGRCAVMNLSEDYRIVIEHLNEDLMLEEIELNILDVLNREGRAMRANDISEMVDASYQLVGRRTSKLRDLGYIDKKTIDGVTLNAVTDTAKSIYFNKEGNKNLR